MKKTHKEFLKQLRITWISQKCRIKDCKFAAMAGFYSDALCPKHYYKYFIKQK